MHERARAALERLREGNRRFVESKPRAPEVGDLTAPQDPFAVAIGCSDSRVPVEMLFDQGAGDLFVIRVAGAVVAPTQIGSVEFAVDSFDPALVVVLGHTLCGAVQAALSGVEPDSEHLRAVVELVRPAVDAPGPVRGLVALGVERLQGESTIVAHAVAKKGLAVVGAVFDHESGEVEFLEG